MKTRTLWQDPTYIIRQDQFRLETPDKNLYVRLETPSSWSLVFHSRHRNMSIYNSWNCSPVTPGTGTRKYLSRYEVSRGAGIGLKEDIQNKEKTFVQAKNHSVPPSHSCPTSIDFNQSKTAAPFQHGPSCFHRQWTSLHPANVSEHFTYKTGWLSWVRGVPCFQPSSTKPVVTFSSTCLAFPSSGWISSCPLETSYFD